MFTRKESEYIDELSGKIDKIYGTSLYFKILKMKVIRKV